MCGILGIYGKEKLDIEKVKEISKSIGGSGTIMTARIARMPKAMNRSVFFVIPSKRFRN